MRNRTQEIWHKQCELAWRLSDAMECDDVAIPLTQDQVTWIDIEDFDLVRDSGPWHVSWAENTRSFYAVRNISAPGGKRPRQRLARLLLSPTEGFCVDHTNHDTLDNRRANLRLATINQNNRNKRRGRGSNAFKGVSWKKADRKWAARIWCLNKRYSLGHYDSAADAARAYDVAARELFGEYALTNEDLGLYAEEGKENE